MAHSKTSYPLSLENSELVGISNITPQPYEFNVDAKENLEEVYHFLVSQIDARSGPEVKRLNSCLAAVCYQLGRIYYDINRNSGLAESMFLQAKDAVEDHESEPDNILSVINSLNMLGLIKEKYDKNHEEALQFFLEAEYVYQLYCELKFGPPTPVNVLLNCPISSRQKNKNPLISARLYSLFYIIEVYKSRNMITDALICTHFTLRLQLENDYFLQSPLDWALTSAMIAELFCQQNAYKLARHHLAAASTFIEKIIPEDYPELYNSKTFKQYSADISYCWSQYGLRLLKKSKSRWEKQKKHRKAPVIFASLLFKNFNILDEERVTQYYVTSYKDAQILANNILMWLDQTKEYYTFEKTDTYYACLCLDTCRTYTLLSSFQEDPNKMGKLFKKGIVDLELVANRLNEENGLNICRKVWYELGTVYSDMMDIKYERHVIYKKDLTECITKTINRYSKLSIKYYTRFIQSFYVDRKLPERLNELFITPVLLAYLHMAKCHNKKIVNQKDLKLEIILQCKQYYQTFLNYCETDPRTEDLIPIEMETCKELLSAIPSKIELLLKTKEPVTFFV